MKTLFVLILCCGSALAGAAHDGLTRGMDCQACHTTSSWQLSANATQSKFDHDKTGFALRGGHIIACGSCHTGASTPASNCVGCHRDPHDGRMDDQCYECHNAVAWSDVAQLEQHRRTRMPLTGKHAMIECVACHKRQSERGYTDLPVDCYSCHARDYHRPDIHPDHDGEPTDLTVKPRPRDCGRCHRTIAWLPASVDPATAAPPAAARVDHDAYFDLTTGSHRTVECAACHADTSRMREARCTSCHTSLALQTQHGRSIASRAATCLGCHPRGQRR